jgi:hypothetical protein
MKKTPAEFMKQLKSRLDEVSIHHSIIDEDIIDAMVEYGYGQPTVSVEREHNGPHFDVVTEEIQGPTSYIATFKRKTTEPRGSLANFVSTVKVQQHHTHRSPCDDHPGQICGYVGPGIEHITYAISIGGNKFVPMLLEKLVAEIKNKLSPNDQSKQISEDEARKVYGFGERSSGIPNRNPISLDAKI